ncbi:MAG: DUF6850 family outer membrane beta-barrel protein [Chitinophagaceae bacterium]
MIRTRFCYLLLTLAGMFNSRWLQAQDTASANAVFAEQFHRRYDFFAGGIATQPLTGISNYMTLNAGYRQTGGAYRQAQEAPRQRDLSFFTEGMRRTGKYLVSGSFVYTHTLQDSVSYTLRYGLTNPQPYYFFAYRKGNWQVGQYRLQGSVSRAFLREKLHAGLSVKYNTINAWRSNDPRPEQFSYNMHIDAGLLYRFLPKHAAGVSGSIIRTNTENTVEYRNKDYQMSLAFPEYVTRIQYGYGFEDRISTAPLKSNTTGYGWQAVYKGSFAFGEVAVKGGYTSLESKIEGAATALLPTGKYGEFYEDSWNAALYWDYQRQRNRFSLLAEYTNHLGRDFNQFLQANNYVYSFEQLRLQPLFTHIKDNKPRYELGLDLRLSDLFRADGNAGTLADYLQAQAGVSAAWFAHFPGRQLLKTTIAAAYRQSIDPLYTSPVQQSVFISSVIAHDYYYFSADTWRADLSLLYSIPVKKVNAFIRLQAGYEKATIPAGTVQAAALPGDQRWYWQAGAGVSL